MGDGEGRLQVSYCFGLERPAQRSVTRARDLSAITPRGTRVPHRLRSVLPSARALRFVLSQGASDLVPGGVRAGVGV